MAFEVARIHGIIRSNIGEDGSSSKASPMLRGVVVREGTSLFDSQTTQPTGSHFACRRLDDPQLCDSSASWPDVANSSLSSSLPHSTDTEGDEEDDDDGDLLAGLAQHIAETILDEDVGVVDQGPRDAHPETQPREAPNAPASSWSSGSSWSSVHLLASSTASSTSSSSRVSSQVSSPPTTPLEERQSDAWDLLSTAAGKVWNSKMKEQTKGKLSFATTGCDQHIQRQPVQAHTQAPVGSGLPDHMLARNGPLKAVSPPCTPRQSYLRNEEAKRIAMQGSANQQRWNSIERGEDHALHSSGQIAVKAAPGAECQSRADCEYQHQQQQHGWHGLKKGCKCQYRSERFMDYNTPQWTNRQGSGMRAVFLGSRGSGQESSGTGVFIPRRAGNGPELKRKPACSTVLLPSRIVQALNLNLESMCSNPSLPSSLLHSAAQSDHLASMPASPGVPHSLSTVAMEPSKSSFEESELASCRKKACPSILQQQNAASELSLLSEWTY